MIVYLAAPYTHPDPEVVEKRVREVTIVAARLMSQGWHVFSPITHTHPIAKVGKLPSDWTYWQEYDRKFLAVCGKLIVLRLDGWKESMGVQAEIQVANELNLPVEYL